MMILVEEASVLFERNCKYSEICDALSDGVNDHLGSGKNLN